MQKYKIGLLAVHSAIDYPHSLRMGVQNTIEEAGHILVTIAELIPYHTLTNAESYLRVACEIASRLDLDAVIFPAGCMTAYLEGDTPKALELLQLMDESKTLVLERSVPGFRCLVKDNAPGMHECMRHLIEDCGFTNIAFISGPEHSTGAREREAIYFEEMRAHGIDPAPSLFARGVFSGDCADVIDKVIDNNPDLQAIACACDLIAYTAYSVLHERGLNVGENIAVTGFDDNPRSAHLDPPLSTVHMTSYDYGCMAASEAIRLCAGLEQEHDVLPSTFIARNSCGEDVRNDVQYYRELLRRQPFPTDKFVDGMVDSTLMMAGPRIRADFRAQMGSFIGRVREAVLSHRLNPSEDDLLFSSQDLTSLFSQDYRAHLSLEGFHSAAITLLEALLEESPQEDVAWVIEQISHLHLRIARLLSSATQADTLESNKREWITSHTVDDALREDRNPKRAYYLIMQELARMGISEADLLLLEQPVEFAGARGFALNDKLRLVASVNRGEPNVYENEEKVIFQELLSHAQTCHVESLECIVGGILAGNELIGIALMDGGTLSDHDQLMVYLNLGFALKHLQMIATEREMNEVLNQNNLLLTQQSQQDAMTGLLNRRGFQNRVTHLLKSEVGSTGAILFLDLDGLKTINDTFGHEHGDDAIKTTATILSAHIPDDGALSRLGGDEFVAFMALRDGSTTDEVIAAIQRSMKDFESSHGLPYSLSISAGASEFVIDESTPDCIEELMREADERLYQMKRKHKGSRRFEQS